MPSMSHMTSQMRCIKKKPSITLSNTLLNITGIDASPPPKKKCSIKLKIHMKEKLKNPLRKNYSNATEYNKDQIFARTCPPKKMFALDD